MNANYHAKVNNANKQVLHCFWVPVSDLGFEHLRIFRTADCIYAEGAVIRTINKLSGSLTLLFATPIGDFGN